MNRIQLLSTTAIVSFYSCLAHSSSPSAAMTSSSAPTVQYYIGEAITLDAGKQIATRLPYLLARSEDPEAKTISERVVSKHQSGFGEHSSVLHVEGTHFTMTEPTGTVTGEGDLTGANWQWTFLKARFEVKGGMTIVDYNFFAEANTILGHKEFFVPSATNPQGMLIRQEDLVLHAVSKEIFESERKNLLHPQS